MTRWRDEDEYMASMDYRNQEEAFSAWCEAHGLDPDDAQSSVIYEQWWQQEVGYNEEEQ